MRLSVSVHGLTYNPRSSIHKYIQVKGRIRATGLYVPVHRMTYKLRPYTSISGLRYLVDRYLRDQDRSERRSPIYFISIHGLTHNPTFFQGIEFRRD